MLNKIEEGIEAIRRGEMVIVVDDEDRENEGDFVMAARFASPEAINFMSKEGRGLICIALTEDRCMELNLAPMVSSNTSLHETAFTVSVDLISPETTTGISASDRSKTVLALIDTETKPSDLGRPGHIFPLRSKEGGVLKRAGHTEAAVDLMEIAKLYPAGIICELIHDDGTMMRLPQLKFFAKQHNIPIITVAELIRYRREKEKLIKKISQARLPTAHGEFTAFVYESLLDGIEHVALVKGEVSGKKNVLVRVHSECLTGDVFESKRCDCGSQLTYAMAKIAEEGEGVILYLRGHEGRGIGLGHKLRAYQLQDNGLDTVDANLELGLPVDSREYGIGAQILTDLGITTMRLMTNNPSKYVGLTGYDLQIAERFPLPPFVTEENARYLKTKKERMGHLFEMI